MYPFTDRILEVYWDGHSLMDLIKRIGMIVPPSTTSQEKYFLENVKDYEGVLTRKSVTVMTKTQISSLALKDSQKLHSELSKFTDQELFGIFGIYVVYKSRKDLINNLLSGLYGLNYFIRFDEVGSDKVTIRYGCKNGSSVVMTPENLKSKLNNLHQMRHLKELLMVYSNLTGNLLSNLEKIIQEKIDWQINLWPASKAWLVC